MSKYEEYSNAKMQRKCKNMSEFMKNMHMQKCKKIQRSIKIK